MLLHDPHQQVVDVLLQLRDSGVALGELLLLPDHQGDQLRPSQLGIRTFAHRLCSLTHNTHRVALAFTDLHTLHNKNQCLNGAFTSLEGSRE